MAIDKKINAVDVSKATYAAKTTVVGQEEVPTLSVAEMQQSVEYMPRNLLAPKINELVIAVNESYSREETDAAINEKVTEIGAGDMAKAEYDSAGTVQKAGGIAGYVSGQVNPVANRVTKLETKTKCFECTLDANSWSATAPYKQTVAVSGVTDAWIPGTPTFKPDALLSTPDKLNLRLQEFAKVNMVESGSGKLTFTCFEEKPTGHLYLRIPGVMKL